MAWAWGNNNYGQLGDGTKENRYEPVQVKGGHKFTKIVYDRGCCIALDEQGMVWAWGNNIAGQLGDGTTVQRREPVPVLVKK